MKKIIIFFLILIFLFSGCQKNSNPSIDDDLLCGYYLSVYNEEERLSSLGGDFLASDGIWRYLSDKKANGSVGELVVNSGKNVAYVSEKSASKGICINSDLLLEDNLYFTNKLLGKTFKVYKVFKKQSDESVYFSEEKPEIINLQGDLTFARQIELSQRLESNGKNENGEKISLKFNSSIKIIYKQIDFLTNVDIVEYDEFNNPLKTTTLYFQDEIISFKAGENTKTVMVKETFEQKNLSGEVLSTYEKNSKFVKSTENSNYNCVLFYPQDNGFCLPCNLSIKF